MTNKLNIKSFFIIFYSFFIKIGASLFLLSQPRNVIGILMKTFLHRPIGSLYFLTAGDFKNVQPWFNITLFKKRLRHRCFRVKFVKFPRTPFCIEHVWWLLLKLFTVFIHVDKKHIHTLSWKVYVHLKHIPHTILASLLLFGTIKIPLNFEIYFTETDLQRCLINHNTTRVFQMKFHYQQCIRGKWRTTECFINLVWCNQSVTQNSICHGNITSFYH